MSSRSLDDLDQFTKDAAKKHIELCKAKGVELLIYCTLRSNKEQDELYAIGRTVKGKIVTNARAGESAHNPNKQGKASGYDCVGLINGKPAWSDKKLYSIIGSIGEEVGLSWSGRWGGSLKETAHFQNPSWSKNSK